MSGQVKAFMSVRSKRDYMTCTIGMTWPMAGQTMATLAEREARMILEIAQPPQPDYRHLGSGVWSLFEVGEQYPNTSPVADFGFALAEALREFVR